MVGHAGALQQRRERVDVDLLVLALVVLGVGRRRELAGAQVPRVPPGRVGGPAAELLGAATGLEGLGQLLRAGLEVGVPPEPAAVARIEVHNDVGQVEVLDGVGDAVAVTAGAALARVLVRVGDKVGQRVGLDDERKGRVGVGLDDLDDGVDVLALVLGQLADLQLTVGALAAQSRPGRS